MVGRGGDKGTRNGMLVCGGDLCSGKQHSQALWKLEAWWDYASAAYLCVKTQQCATNVIPNPELHVLGIKKQL